MQKKEWDKTTQYIHSFLIGHDGAEDPWIDARIIHDFSFRGFIAAAYAENIEKIDKLLNLHSSALRNLGKNDELEWIRKSQLQIFNTPTKLRYADLLFNTGRLEEALDICRSISFFGDGNQILEKQTRNLLGLISRDG